MTEDALCKTMTFCAEAARDRGEFLPGTASQFKSLFLLECPEAWGIKALDDSILLSPGVKQALKDKIAGLDQPRLLLIKQTEKPRGVINLFVVNNAATEPYYNHFTFDTYEDIAAFDFAAALERRDTSETTPLYMICTNGNKDKCCAKFGMICYKEVGLCIPPERVWQCAHVGGDRFAPNIVTAPAGMYFGGVLPHHTQDVVTSIEVGQIDMHYYRGRCCLSKAAQTAEYYAREAWGNNQMQDTELVEQQIDGDDATVTIRETSTGRTATVVMQLVQSDTEDYLTCRDTEKGRTKFYRLVSIT